MKYTKFRLIICYITIIVSIMIPWRSINGQQIRYEDYELQSSVPEYSDQFGFAVSVYDNIAVIGDYADKEQGGNSGAAYIYEYVPGYGWHEDERLIEPFGGRNYSFGWTVAAGKDFVAVLSGKDQGYIYVYRHYDTGLEWRLEARIKSSIGDLLGPPIAISGDTIIAGGPYSNDFGSDSGNAYIFRHIGDGQWIEEAKLLPSDPKIYSNFGWSVSIDGDVAAIGADLNRSSYERQGSVYIFRRQPDKTWIEEAKLQALDGEVGDLFGFSVSLEGNRLLIGAPYDGNSTHPGYAYFWEYINGSWVEKSKVTSSDGESGDVFGVSVSLSGDIALMGACYDLRGGSGYIFRYNNNDDFWVEQNKLLASDSGWPGEWLGEFVSLDKDIALLGSRWHEDVGAAYVYHNIAPLSLQIKGSCPGPMQVTVYGGEVGDRLAVVYGVRKGSSEVLPYCPGLFVDIGQPIRIASYGKADEMGEFSVTGNIPQKACGRLFLQGINITKCEKTRVMILE